MICAAFSRLNAKNFCRTTTTNSIQVGVAGPYPISYRSLTPKKSECENLLVPVCCSASHIAMTSIRMEPVWITLGLSAGQVSASREVLRRCGNMSSATILFVLEEILKRPSGKGRERVCAVAFGPGLTVEMATLEAIFAPDAAGVGPAAALLLSPG